MTIKEIAAMCGVSRGTVDRVLNHRGRVKPETERAVRAALEQAGYTKNIAGRALTVSRLAPRIGVVLCCLDNPFFDEVLKGIAQAEEELQDWGVHVELRLLRGYDAAAQRAAGTLVYDPDIQCSHHSHDHGAHGGDCAHEGGCSHRCSHTD